MFHILLVLHWSCVGRGLFVFALKMIDDVAFEGKDEPGINGQGAAGKYHTRSLVERGRTPSGPTPLHACRSQGLLWRFARYYFS